MDLVNEIPVLIFHVVEANVPQDARVVDEHMDASKRLDRSINDCVSILDTVVVGNSFSASCFNFVDNGVGGLRIG